MRLLVAEAELLGGGPYGMEALNVLRIEKEPQNKFDQYAVKVFKDDLDVGYIKKIHNKVFYKQSKFPIKLTVKAIDKNGAVKRVFVKVSF